MSVFKDGNSWAYKGKIAIPFEPGKYKSYYKRGFSKKKDAQDEILIDDGQIRNKTYFCMKLIRLL